MAIIPDLMILEAFPARQGWADRGRQTAGMENRPTKVRTQHTELGSRHQAWWPMWSMRNTTRAIHLFKDPPAALFSGVDFIYPEPLYRITHLQRSWNTKGSNRRNSKSPQVTILKEVRPNRQRVYEIPYVLTTYFYKNT
jgi:hypothetical protein